MNIYLASESPRRKIFLEELLAAFGIKFDIIKSSNISNEEFVEIDTGHSAEDIAVFNAKGKATHVSGSVKKDSVVIGADTVVAIEEEILGKPADKNEAREFLKKLSGKSHSVFTGVAMLNTTTKIITTGCEETIVTFYDISDEEIEWYISTNEPFDKAGAYGIQGLGEVFVKKTDGSFSNVVGLPKRLVLNLLRQVGVQCHSIKQKIDN